MLRSMLAVMLVVLSYPAAAQDRELIQGVPMGSSNMQASPAAPSAGLALSSQIEMRIAMLKAELGLSGRQTSAFDSYANALRSVGTNMQRYEAEAKVKGMNGTAMDKYDLQLGLMESHLKDMKTLRAKMQTLYRALTPEQKLIADQILVAPGQ